MSNFASSKVRNLLIALIVILALLSSVAYYVRIGPFSYLNSTTSESSQTSIDTTFTTFNNFGISINYSGSWRLVYWGHNGTVTQYNYTQYNVKGNLTGSGNHGITVVTYAVGYEENTLCANATKLDSQPNITLTLWVLTSQLTNSSTPSDPSAEVCATIAP